MTAIVRCLQNGCIHCPAGNASAGCALGNPPVASDVSPGILQAALRSPLAPPTRAVVDRVSGDLYWTEAAGRRVFVLRGSGARGPFRIAGNGADGGRRGSTVATGSKALNSALSGPTAITVDPSGAPVFIDGVVVQASPGNVVRLAPDGSLVVLVACAVVPPFELLYVDGPFATATAQQFTGLAFIGDLLNISDNAASAAPPVWAAVRSASLTAGTLSTIAGSQNGVLGDGYPSLQARFLSISSIAVFPGGDMVDADRSANVLRVVINKASTASVSSAS